jgi:uncharacterized protein YbaR (Trm112 family)
MLDTKKSLDYQKHFIQTMEDILLYHIRYAKKELERELKIIFLQYKKYLTESKTKSEFSQKINILSTKLINIKKKLMTLKTEEKEMILELKNRFNKTVKYLGNNDKDNSQFINFKEYNIYQNNILLGQYFIEHGFLETFFCFQKENNLIIYEYNFFAEKKLLINYINEEKSKKILEWIKFYKKKIIQNDPDTILNILCNLFYIYKNEHINEPDCNIKCVNFIRKYFSSFTNINREEITKLIMSLITSKNNNKNENNNTKIMSTIKTTINEKYKELFGLGIYSLFELLTVLGITALKTSVCDKKEKINEECPICKEQGYFLNENNNKIFNYVHNRSYLFCSITGKVTNSANPPMVNKDGKIICKECINKYKISDEKYLDPKTKKEYNISDCKLLYLS